MTAYEFYVIDKTKGKSLIGILPERRKAQERINDDSIRNWAKLVFGGIFDPKDIFFEKVAIYKDSCGNYYPRAY